MPGSISLDTGLLQAKMPKPAGLLGDPVSKAAREFEAVYLTEMMRPMLETVPVSEAFGGGHGEEIFRDMLADEYGKMMARTGGIGLASSVKAAMIAAQEAANNNATR